MRKKSSVPIEQRRSKLRLTKEIAELSGFEYPDNATTQYGGIFNIYHLEKIADKLKELRLIKSERKFNSEDKTV